MQVLTLLGLGLLLGLRHAADPDHVVAVTTIAARTRRVLPATLLGIVWGLGHTLTLFAVGAAIIVFNWSVPPRIGLTLELCVALALVVVGLLNLKPHRHDRSELGQEPGRPPAGRAFLVGLVHGLAGSAAVALLVLATVGDPRWAFGYLLVFGLGTLIGMALITTGFALPVALAMNRWAHAGRLIRVSTGALSLAFGIWLVYQIGWLDGLFMGTPHWTAH
ncbi:MAG TPA: HupE/UreJ family protein [Candidatus Eisenbacteria bacterium]|nr:HupE/UreJ family protein [Candidatus Eisenbacteria bacterium]